MECCYVLAIEHDWRMRKLIRANLEALGYQVREAVSGQHGLQLLDQSLPDLILLDLDLPDVDARKLLGTVNALIQGRGVSIIVLAAEPPERSWWQGGQAVSYLQKPFAAPALLYQVHQALADSSRGQVCGPNGV